MGTYHSIVFVTECHAVFNIHSSREESLINESKSCSQLALAHNIEPVRPIDIPLGVIEIAHLLRCTGLAGANGELTFRLGRVKVLATVWDNGWRMTLPK